MHTFEPGLFGDEALATKFGGTRWLLEVVRFLESEGHEVNFAFPHRSYFDGDLILSHDRIEKMTPNKMPIVTSKSDILDHDVALFYYRWPMPDRPERQYAYACQQLVFEWYDEANKPYIVFDGDHMITEQVAMMILKGSGKIAAPEIRPLRSYIRTLMYPNINYAQRSDVPRDNSIVYVGNDYGRRAQTIEFMNPLTKAYDVKIFGNWGTTDEQHSRNKAEMPDVQFMGPVDSDQVIPELTKALWTVHLMKPSYVDSGFCTFRWVEAIMARTPAFVPARFPFPYEYVLPNSRDWKTLFGYVKNGEDALTIGNDLRDVIFTNQRAFVEQRFHVESWRDALSDCAKGEWL